MEHEYDLRLHKDMDPRIDFPYFVVRHLPAVYQVLPCPEGKSRVELIELALAIAKKVTRCACVVFGRKDSVFVEPEGSCRWSDNPPRGGAVYDLAWRQINAS